MKKTRKPQSAKQKANLLTGQLLFKCSCTTELIKFLKEYGHTRLAFQVELGLKAGRSLAYSVGRIAIAEANRVVEEADKYV